MGNIFSVPFCRDDRHRLGACICALTINLTPSGSNPDLSEFFKESAGVVQASNQMVAVNDFQRLVSQEEKDGFWLSFAKFVVRNNVLIAVAVLVASSPFAWRLSRGFRHSSSLMQLVPRDAAATGS